MKLYIVGFNSTDFDLDPTVGYRFDREDNYGWLRVEDSATDATRLPIFFESVRLAKLFEVAVNNMWNGKDDLHCYTTHCAYAPIEVKANLKKVIDEN